MPELLEVEYYRRLAEGVVGRRVRGIDAPDAWYLRATPGAEELRAMVVGATITAVRRTGKLLIVDLDDDASLGLHFGMTGRLIVDGRAAIDRLEYSSARSDPTWQRFGVRFQDGGELVIIDPRRLGGVSLDPDETALGVDAGVVRLAELRAALAATRTTLKARLMDQSRLAGLGNLLTDEILWRARLTPARVASSLSETETRRLHRTMGATLVELDGRGGSHTGDLFRARQRGGRCPRCSTVLARHAARWANHLLVPKGTALNVLARSAVPWSDGPRRCHYTRQPGSVRAEQPIGSAPGDERAVRGRAVIGFRWRRRATVLTCVLLLSGAEASWAQSDGGSVAQEQNAPEQTTSSTTASSVEPTTTETTPTQPSTTTTVIVTTTPAPPPTVPAATTTTEQVVEEEPTTTTAEETVATTRATTSSTIATTSTSPQATTTAPRSSVVAPSTTRSVGGGTSREQHVVLLVVGLLCVVGLLIATMTWRYWWFTNPKRGYVKSRAVLNHRALQDDVDSELLRVWQNGKMVEPPDVPVPGSPRVRAQTDVTEVWAPAGGDPDNPETTGEHY